MSQRGPQCQGMVPPKQGDIRRQMLHAAVEGSHGGTGRSAEVHCCKLGGKKEKEDQPSQESQMYHPKDLLQ